MLSIFSHCQLTDNDYLITVFSAKNVSLNYSFYDQFSKTQETPLIFKTEMTKSSFATQFDYFQLNNQVDFMIENTVTHLIIPSGR